MMKIFEYGGGKLFARATLLVMIGLAAPSAVAPVLAQTASLGSAQTSSVQSALTTAIRGANGNAAATAAAISTAVQNAVAANGAATAGSITSVALTVGEGAGAAPAQIGTGLAQAAVALAPAGCASGGDCGAAAAIAQTLANEGTPAEIVAFQAAMTAAGFANLAAVAGSSATPTAATNAVATNGNQPLFGNNANNTPLVNCLNPSCTKAF